MSAELLKRVRDWTTMTIHRIWDPIEAGWKWLWNPDPIELILRQPGGIFVLWAVLVVALALTLRGLASEGYQLAYDWKDTPSIETKQFHTPTPGAGCPCARTLRDTADLRDALVCIGVERLPARPAGDALAELAAAQSDHAVALGHTRRFVHCYLDKKHQDVNPMPEEYTRALDVCRIEQALLDARDGDNEDRVKQLLPGYEKLVENGLCKPARNVAVHTSIQKYLQWRHLERTHAPGEVARLLRGWLARLADFPRQPEAEPGKLPVLTGEEQSQVQQAVKELGRLLVDLPKEDRHIVAVAALQAKWQKVLDTSRRLRSVPPVQQIRELAALLEVLGVNRVAGDARHMQTVTAFLCRRALPPKKDFDSKVRIGNSKKDGKVEGDDVERSEVKILWKENNDTGEPKKTPLGAPYDEFSANDINVRFHIDRFLHKGIAYKFIGPTDKNKFNYQYNQEWDQLMAHAEADAPLGRLRTFAEKHEDRKLLLQIDELLGALQVVAPWATPVKAAIAP